MPQSRIGTAAALAAGLLCAGGELAGAEPGAASRESLAIWHIDQSAVPGAVVGDRVFAWDSKLDGIAEFSTITGQRLRTRSIAKLNINGEPSYWEPVPGGYLAMWHRPTFVRESGERLAVGWVAPDERWMSTYVLSGGILYTASEKALVALSATDGHALWRVPLDQLPQSLTLSLDDTTLYASTQVYSLTSPTPKVTVPRRLRAYSRQNGNALWSMDFAEEPGVLATRRGIVVAAVGGDLRFLDGASGKLIKTVSGMGPPNIYPRALLAGDQVYVALDGTPSAVTAFDLATGAQRWQRTLALDGGPELAIVGDRLLVTLARGGVAALERSTGALRWQVGLGLRGYRLMANERAVVVGASGRTVGLPMPSKVALERATISGSVRCGASPQVVVTVGDTQVKLDDKGHYQATISAAGVVLVSAADPMATYGERPLIADSATVVLTGAGTYRVAPLDAAPCPAP